MHDRVAAMYRRRTEPEPEPGIRKEQGTGTSGSESESEGYTVSGYSSSSGYVSFESGGQKRKRRTVVMFPSPPPQTLSSNQVHSSVPIDPVLLAAEGRDSRRGATGVRRGVIDPALLVASRASASASTSVSPRTLREHQHQRRDVVPYNNSSSSNREAYPQDHISPGSSLPANPHSHSHPDQSPASVNASTSSATPSYSINTATTNATTSVFVANPAPKPGPHQTHSHYPGFDANGQRIGLEHVRQAARFEEQERLKRIHPAPSSLAATGPTAAETRKQIEENQEPQPQRFMEPLYGQYDPEREATDKDKDMGAGGAAL